jgi:hypothetical protein
MCWVCDKEEAEALLVDSKRVLQEADTLRQHGCHMQAQAYGDMYKADLQGDKDSTVCKEVEDAL